MFISEIDVSKIKPKNIPVQNDKPDELSKKEEAQYALDALTEKQRLENEAFSQNIAERKKYAKHIYFLIVGWLVGLFVVIGLEGFGICQFKLSEKCVTRTNHRNNSEYTWNICDSCKLFV